MKKGARLLSLILCLWLPACSENPPQLLDVEWQVVLFRNRLLGVTYQKLSLFVRGTDEDGQNDLQALHLINDDEELYWTIQSDQWEKATIRGNEWFGSNGFTVPDNGRLPIGSYRVVLEDLSGKTTQTQIYIKRENTDTDNALFPDVALAGTTINVTGDFIDPEIWVYDANDQFLFRMPLPEKSIAVAALVSRNKALESGFTYYLYAKKNGVYYSVLSGPYYYPS